MYDTRSRSKIVGLHRIEYIKSTVETLRSYLFFYLWIFQVHRTGVGHSKFRSYRYLERWRGSTVLGVRKSKLGVRGDLEKEFPGPWEPSKRCPMTSLVWDTHTRVDGHGSEGWVPINRKGSDPTIVLTLRTSKGSEECPFVPLNSVTGFERSRKNGTRLTSVRGV